jgi:hypothetical protein
MEEDDDLPTREHVAGCVWCQQELARYMAVDAALRRGYGAAAHESMLPFPFDQDGDVDGAESYAFTLEETMADGYDPHDLQPSATARSARWGDRKRRPSPRATAIAAIAAALILTVIATAVYAQFAARRTASPPPASSTSGALTTIVLPRATSLTAWTTAPDGSFWYATASPGAAIGHATPHGIITAFPVPTNDAVSTLWTTSMAIALDGSIWLTGAADRGATTASFITRMTPDGAFTRIPLPAGLSVGRLLAGRDGALWFSGGQDLNPSASATPVRVIGQITSDGHTTTFTVLAQSAAGVLLDMCIGPDQALWYTWASSLSGSANVTGRIGRVAPSGQAQEFAVPYIPDSIASGADGALWYSEGVPGVNGDTPSALAHRTGYIGRITTAGAASELPIDPMEGVGQVATGSDGAIWYTVRQDQTGAFGRITPSGGIKTFATNGNAAISAIASAPGALWLLDARNNLWRYRLPA